MTGQYWELRKTDIFLKSEHILTQILNRQPENK